MKLELYNCIEDHSYPTEVYLIMWNNKHLWRNVPFPHTNIAGKKGESRGRDAGSYVNDEIKMNKSKEI